MNFLAHIYLSGSFDNVMIGNFIADAVKGNQLQKYHPDIRKGIMLHRKIDHFTDTHPVVAKSKLRLRAEYGKYAAVIVDIYYDHFLARQWASFSDIPLPEYSLRAYRCIQNKLWSLPQKVQFLFPHMVQGNWLVNYSSLEGINRTFSGMSKRTTFPSGMETAVIALQENYSSYQYEFLEFFPEVKALSEDFLNKKF